MTRKHILHAVLLLIASACPVIGAQSPIEIRFVAERLPRDLGEVTLASGELRSTPFNLSMNNLSEPQEAPARTFSLLSLAHEKPLANIKLPEQGNSFVVLLIPASKKGYTPVVMAYENPDFRGGDIFFYNNTEHLVLGIVGTSKFKLNPASSTVLRPKGARKERFFDVWLGIREEGQNRVISTTRWPERKSTRTFLFFYIDPKKNHITYRGVDEFLMPDED